MRTTILALTSLLALACSGTSTGAPDGSGADGGGDASAFEWAPGTDVTPTPDGVEAVADLTDTGTPAAEVADTGPAPSDVAEGGGVEGTEVTEPGTEVAEPGTEPGTEVAEPGTEVAEPGTEPGTEVAETGDAADTTEPDTSEPDLGEWRQCDDDATCQAIFGASGYCNRNFPGGQCWGCDPEDLGHIRCTQLAHGDQSLSCKIGYNLCLFDCPCPSWLRCQNDECVLKTCTSDDECGPLFCRPISEGGTRYCLEP